MKVYLKTFGCRANQYDTETVRAMVERGGGTIVSEPGAADAAVFNSCAVTAAAVADLRQEVRRAARQRPGLATIVMGCAASLDRGTLGALPSVAQVVPGADYTAIAAALDLPAGALGAATQQSGTRGLLRIQDGCDEHCTFCATTQARGDNRSRPVAELLDEAARLAERHAEIVLTGVHIGTYGTDFGSSLGVLIERLILHVPQARFRLSSVEATEVDDRLADCFADPAHLVPHLHAPLQSGADRVLKRMGRNWYTAASYAAALRRLVGGRHVFGLGADVMAGFPGETEADHAETLALLRDLPFTYLHVFPYSLRPGTAAARLKGQVPGEESHVRAHQLRELGRELGARYAATRHAGTADVVVLRGDVREGVTEDYLTVPLVGEAAPRGARLTMQLQLDATGTLVAHPVAPAHV